MPSFRLFVAAALLSLSACKNNSSNVALDPSAPQIPDPINHKTAGRIEGAVVFSGTPPAPQKIVMTGDANCAVMHNGDVFSDEIVVNPNNTLKNVYVYVKSGLDPTLRFPIPAPALLDQKGCAYDPHVIAVQTGQTLDIRNSDGVFHNVNVAAKVNEGFNIGQAVEGTVTNHVFDKPEVMIRANCDVHPWMRSYIGVQTHPYAAVTGTDGAFSFESLPPGTYEIEAWHEKYGTQTQTVTVGPKEKKKITFTFKAS